MFSFIFSRGKGVFVKKALPLFLAFCFVVTLFSGCNLDGGGENTRFIPVGEWVDSSGGGYDVTSTKIKYYTAAWGNPGDPDYFPPSELEGDIEDAVDFSRDAGVLIIKVTGTPSTGNTAGNYTAVYYKDYTAQHIFLANPIGPEPLYAPVETVSLNEALNTFTEGNVTTHVKNWGSGYTK